VRLHFIVRTVAIVVSIDDPVIIIVVVIIIHLSNGVPAICSTHELSHREHRTNDLSISATVVIVVIVVDVVVPWYRSIVIAPYRYTALTIDGRTDSGSMPMPENNVESACP